MDIASPTRRSSMSAKKKSNPEGEFEEHLSSEKGAWTNAWSPTWEDASPSIAVSFDDLGDDLPEESASLAPKDQSESE
jgi:hypothetical protein